MQNKAIQYKLNNIVLNCTSKCKKIKSVTVSNMFALRTQYFTTKKFLFFFNNTTKHIQLFTVIIPKAVVIRTNEKESLISD